MKFEINDKVRKIGGSYQATGTIVSRFKALDGSSRYVFQFDSPAGLVHILGDNNLEPYDHDKHEADKFNKAHKPISEFRL